MSELELKGCFAPVTTGKKGYRPIRASIRVLGHQIGSGGFSRVMSGVALAEDKWAFSVAVKVIEVAKPLTKALEGLSQGYSSRKQQTGGSKAEEPLGQDDVTEKRKSTLEEALWEKEVLIQLRDSPYVVNFVGYCVVGWEVYLVLEECAHLAIIDVLEKIKSEMLAEAVFYFLVPIADALRFMHERKLIHRDLKPENILLTWKGVPKLADYGLTKSMTDDSMPHVPDGAGTKFFIAPEVIMGKKYDGKVDGWAFALTAAALFGKVRVDILFEGKSWDKVSRTYEAWDKGTAEEKEQISKNIKQPFKFSSRKARAGAENYKFILDNFILIDVSKRYSMQEYCEEKQVAAMLKLWRGENVEMDLTDKFLKMEAIISRIMTKAKLDYADFRAFE